MTRDSTAVIASLVSRSSDSSLADAMKRSMIGWTGFRAATPSPGDSNHAFVSARLLGLRGEERPLSAGEHVHQCTMHDTASSPAPGFHRQWETRLCLDQRTFTCTHTDGSRKPPDVSLLKHAASQTVQQTLELSPPAPVVVRTLSLGLQLRHLTPADSRRTHVRTRRDCLR